MKLIIGLGNPEEKYRNTRHNVGFLTLSRYSAKKSVTFQPKTKFNACIAELTVADEKIILAKPTTYYNLSGEAARALRDFYKIQSKDILILHDELMLPFGTIRTRIGGNDAGNNGIKSINDHIGQETSRIRIGVSNENRDRINDADFVLGAFSQSEAQELDTMQPHIDCIIDDFIAGKFSATTHKTFTL
ncbi:MAG: aminoacyl-tRNA hydrolase [Candidatus Saccharimonadales bacterium]